ncbi:unnamed protein product, partial [marine sediment metagenome]
MGFIRPIVTGKPDTVYTGFAMPLCLFLLRSYMVNLPTELEEAAYIEGASFPKTF